MAFFRLVHHNNVLAQSVNFTTLTFAYEVTFKQANRAVSDFFSRFRTQFPEEISISYISVPELTKKGRWHYHLLIYDISPQHALRERTTRNLQRLFRRGYVDISPTSFIAEGLAGYLAKYMAKSVDDSRYTNTRGYTCSRNIKKIYSTGGNQIDQYYDMILPDVNSLCKVSNYDTMYFGSCVFSLYKNKNI
jgi:hypothetical protein